MDLFLASTAVIDWKHPDVEALAKSLRRGADDPVIIARRCFEWVRDEIKHSRDYRLSPVPCTASEVLQAGSSFCYGKSHLLAALLRANGLPTGLCYQRLSRDDNGAPYSLHGLSAVHLPEVGWYRMDPRGNRPGVNAQFIPPTEQLAFPIALPGEADLPEIWPEPLPIVIQTIRAHATAESLWENLPDIELWTTKTTEDTLGSIATKRAGGSM